MGIKRKSSFDDSSVSPSSISSTSSTSTSANASAWSMSSQHRGWGAPLTPYLNTRTRKRARDSRPDEDTVHQNTLNKLFNAQRSHMGLIEQGESSNRSRTATPCPEPSFSLCSTQKEEGDMEKNQRSLDSWFGIKTPGHRTTRRRAEFRVPISGTTSTCESCSALLDRSMAGALAVDMLCDEGMEGLVVEGNWSCWRCAKRVCDLCAVRGDCRTCLECALPGGQGLPSEGMQEKMWIGGVGWM